MGRRGIRLRIILVDGFRCFFPDYSPSLQVFVYKFAPLGFRNRFAHATTFRIYIFEYSGCNGITRTTRVLSIEHIWYMALQALIKPKHAPVPCLPQNYPLFDAENSRELKHCYFLLEGNRANQKCVDVERAARSRIYLPRNANKLSKAVMLSSILVKYFSEPQSILYGFLDHDRVSQ